MTITRFKDLQCWQEARKIVKMIYAAINSNREFQKDFKLVGQYTAAGVSVMNNTAGSAPQGRMGQSIESC